MEKLEAIATEQQFLNSMVDLNHYLPQGQDYLERKKYSCDPCDACGPDACAQYKGCAFD